MKFFVLFSLSIIILLFSYSCITKSQETIVQPNNEIIVTPLAQKTVDDIKIKPAIDKITLGADLPLPNNITYYSIKNFMLEYNDIYLKYKPLGTELRIYFNILQKDNTDNIIQETEEEVDALKLRIKENFDKSHWVFLYSCDELYTFLKNNQQTMLINDLEENFIARMKVISFMGTELSQITDDKKYINFSKHLYISFSKRYFDRELKEE